MGANGDICVHLIYAAFVSGNWRCEGNYQELKNHHGKFSRSARSNVKFIFMADPIADMVTRIRNAQMLGKYSVAVPYSGIKNEIARVLKETGFIRDAAKRGRRNRRVLDIVLVYDADVGRIGGLRMISKQSRRTYVRAQDLHDSRRSSNGLYIVSTSRGVMSSTEARKARVGGEVLCEVW